MAEVLDHEHDEKTFQIPSIVRFQLLNTLITLDSTIDV